MELEKLILVLTVAFGYPLTRVPNTGLVDRLHHPLIGTRHLTIFAADSSLAEAPDPSNMALKLHRLLGRFCQYLPLLTLCVVH